MRAVVQRVSNARVEVAQECVAEMGEGLLVLVGVGTRDEFADTKELARKLVGLRIFEDEAGKMNRSLLDVGGTLGLVSQFTLWGDVRKGRRPSFGGAAEPERARSLFDALIVEAVQLGVSVVSGVFGAKMNVSLVNAGPVTLILDTERTF
jgi:D-tyrosyl-tRNA(Tyr) deacylase